MTGGSGTSFSFDINVLSSCTVAVLTIDTTIFYPPSSTTMVKSIWDTSISKVYWSDPIVTTKDLNNILLTTCGTIVYEFLDSGSNSLSATSEFNFSLTSRWFMMNTNLTSKFGYWSYKIKASLQSYPNSTAGINNFKVQFINSCEPPTSITLPSAVTT